MRINRSKSFDCSDYRRSHIHMRIEYTLSTWAGSTQLRRKITDNARYWYRVIAFHQLKLFRAVFWCEIFFINVFIRISDWFTAFAVSRMWLHAIIIAWPIHRMPSMYGARIVDNSVCHRMMVKLRSPKRYDRTHTHIWMAYFYVAPENYLFQCLFCSWKHFHTQLHTLIRAMRQSSVWQHPV